MAMILQTRRLLLRHFVPDDLDPLFSMYSDPEVRRFFPEGTLSREDTQEELEWFLNGHPAHPELGLWATVLRESGRLVGRCGLLPWSIDGRDEVEVAYLIDRDLWGRGLGTEAAMAVRDYALGQLGLSRLVCLIDGQNLASVRVAVKMGMSFEKETQDELGPFHLYSLERPQEN